jgi:hypothetical protein
VPFVKGTSASTATRPTFVTMADAPLSGTGCEGCIGDLGATSRKFRKIGNIYRHQ